MTRALLAKLSLLGAVTALVALSEGCGGSAQLTKLTLDPPAPTVQVASTQKLTLSAQFDNGTTATVSSGITWNSSNVAVALVDQTGLVTGVSVGSANIQASAQGLTASATVTVTPKPVPQPTLLSISTGSATQSVSVADSAQLLVTATYDIGPTKNVTASSTFTSADATIATVSSGGLVSGVKAGSTTVTASYSGKTWPVTVTVAVSSPIFFHGAFDSGVTGALVDFGGATPSVIAVDTGGANDYRGFHPLQVTMPTTNYTGGAYVAKTPRDLSAFNALTFWAKASQAITLPVLGFGDNAAGNSSFKTETNDVSIGTTYQKYVLPLPDPSKATAVTGLFYFADGKNYSTAGAPLYLYLADVQYEKLAGTPGGAPAPSFAASTKTLQVGGTLQVQFSDLTATYNAAIAGSAAPNPLVYGLVGPSFFGYSASPAGLVTIGAGGALTGAAAGVATLTASLAGVSTSNTLAVTVIAPLPAPTVAAPTPAADPSKVTSIWSSVKYNGTAADLGSKVNFSDFHGTPDSYKDSVSIAGSSPKKFVFLPPPGHYSGFGFHTAVADEVDVAGKGYDTLHMDLWSPDIATPNPSQLVVGLIDFAKDAGLTFSSQGNIVVSGAGITNSTSTAPQGGWVSYDFKIADFATAGLAATPHNIAQMLFQADFGATVYLDNLYFYTKSGGNVGGAGPTTVAAAPGSAAANVISLFSSTYTGGTAGGDYSANVGSYDASCFGGAPGSSTVADYTIPGTSHKVKQYTVSPNSFISIETIGTTGGTTPGGDSAACNGGTQSGTNRIDISQMKSLHLDVWATKAGVTFNGNVYTAPTLPFNTGAGATSAPIGNTPFAAGTWVPIDFTFSDLTQITKMSMLQLFSGEGGTIYLDNIYFYKAAGGGGTPPAFATITFDDAAITYSFDAFEGATGGAVVADPAGGTNKVGKLVKPSTSHPWGGASIGTAAGFTAGAIPFAAGKTVMTMRIYSPRPGIPMHLKVENSAAGAVNGEVNATALSTATNGWETFTFDFAGKVDPTKTYDKISFFPDFLTDPVPADTTYYFDDIRFGTPPVPFTSVTFDDAAITYSFDAFEGATGGAVVADPAGGTNKVGKLVKPSTSHPWGGATIGTGAGFTVPVIPFTASKKVMTLRVYSPRPGIPMHLKVENSAAGSTNGEVNATATSTLTNGWETFTFDFTGKVDPTKTYDKVSFFPDFLTDPVPADTTYYFDDLTFVP